MRTPHTHTTLAALAVALALGVAPLALVSDVLAAPVATTITPAPLKEFDAFVAEEASCGEVGDGAAAGRAEAAFDEQTGILSYRFALTAADPAALYAVAITECDANGQQQMRGDVGMVTTDAGGAAVLEGAWPVQPGARWVRLAAFRACATTPGEQPIIPCTWRAFASDAVHLPGR